MPIYHITIRDNLDGTYYITIKDRCSVSTNFEVPWDTVLKAMAELKPPTSAHVASLVKP
jgi:hypothetical protein